MPYGLTDTIITQLCDVFSGYPAVTKIILYGSRAMGTFKPGSDIDVTLVGNNLSSSMINRIATELDDLLLPYEIDLSILNQIDNPDLISHIERVGKVLYAAGRPE